MRWPLQPSQPVHKAQLQPPFGPSVNSFCHPCITTTHLSSRVLSLKLPPPPCAVLLDIFKEIYIYNYIFKYHHHHHHHHLHRHHHHRHHHHQASLFNTNRTVYDSNFAMIYSYKLVVNRSFFDASSRIWVKELGYSYHKQTIDMYIYNLHD